MSKSINILDTDYIQWIKDLSSRYRRSQIKASVKVNQEMLQFYWELGKDIVEKKAESRWGSGFMKNLSRDLKEVNPNQTLIYILPNLGSKLLNRLLSKRRIQLLNNLLSKYKVTFFLFRGGIMYVS